MNCNDRHDVLCGELRPHTRLCTAESGERGDMREIEAALFEARRELDIRNRLLEKLVTVPEHQVYGEVLPILLDALSSPLGFIGDIDEDGSLVRPTLGRKTEESFRVFSARAHFSKTVWPPDLQKAIAACRIVRSNSPLGVPIHHVFIGRFLLVPIVLRGTIVGLFGAANKPDDYTERDAELASILTARLSTVLGARLQRNCEVREQRASGERLRQFNVELERQVAERTEALQKEIAERKRKEAEILLLNQSLESRIQERTEALEAANDFLQTVIDTIPVAVFYKVGFRYAGCNAAFERFTGYVRNMVVGATAFDLFPEQNARQFQYADLELCRTGGTVVYDAETLRPDGTLAKVVVHKSVFSQGVDHRVIVGVIHDVTESRTNEEALREARNELEARVIERTLELAETNLELRREIAERQQIEHQLRVERDKFRGILLALREGACIVGPDHVIEFGNDTMRDWFPGSEGRTCDEVFGPQGIEACKRSKAAVGFENEFAAGDRYFELSASAFMDVGRVQKHIVLLRDVTARKAFQQEAVKSAHLTSLGELAAGVAHEINNPVNGIINYAQLLQDEAADTDDVADPDIPGRIIHEGERIARIVKNLLSFARGGENELAPASIRSIVDDALDLMGQQLRKDSIRIHIDVPADLPPVLVNAMQIQQVFINLLSNSRFALNQRFPSPDPGKRLDISAGMVRRDDRDYVRCIFRDSGEGIAPEDIDNICAPFFSTKPKGQGTGLGLSISFGIVKSCGGEISFDSIEGEYTAVMVDLPVV